MEIQDSAFQNGYLSEALGLMALNKYHTEFYAKDRKWTRLNTQLSMIKSWLTNTNKESEELIEMLNKENTNPGYLMGRFMAVADQIQHSAKGKSTLSKDYGRIASKNHPNANAVGAAEDYGNLIKVTRTNTEDEFPHSMDDYEITIDTERVPSGVEVYDVDMWF